MLSVRIKKIIEVIFELVFAAVVFWLLFKLAWLFGHEILDGILVGNDSPFALSLVSWFERFWPRIPLWYPLQGAGVSLFHSYPMLTTFLVIFIKRMTHLTSIEAFRLLSFAVFPLTAFGVYVLAKRKIGNPAAAFFAGVFFLLSQASWVFQRLHGIFAQSFSLVFVPWSFLFFDLFLERRLKDKKRDFITRLAGVLTVILTAFCFLAHPVTGMVVGLGLLGDAFFYSQCSLKLKSGVKKRLGSLFKSLILAAFCLVLSVSLAAFWLIPFYSYNRLANREGLLKMNMGQLKEVSLLPQTLVGFGDFATGDLRYDYFFFALPVILLALVGLLGGILVNGSVLAWGLIAFGAAIFTSLPLYLPSLVNAFKYIFTAVYFRALMATIVLLPIVAGFGAFFMAELPFLIMARLTSTMRKKTPGVIKPGFQVLRFMVVSLVVFITCLFFIIRFEHRPPDEATKTHPAYGIASFKAYGPTLGEDIEILKQGWKTFFLKKPKIKINKEGLSPAPSLTGFIEDFKLNKTSRVDVSAFSGENFLQYAPILTDASFVNLYHYSASIIHRMWGYQQGVFYGQEELYDNPALLEDLSKWFGVEYAVLVPGYDREENYLSVGWELVKAGGSETNRLPIYRFKDAQGILTVSMRPVALVIGSLEDAAYDQVFRTANAGAFSYDDIWLVEGGERVDAYSLDELNKFDLLILHGYDYKNKARAWRLINDYVKGGGSVYIDSGWQFVSRDWGDKNGNPVQLPEPAPVVQVSWGSIGPEWSKLEISPELAMFKTDEYKPLSWNGDKWGAAVANKEMLRQGAEVLISDEQGVVMARRVFGEGKIIWSGMNLISHSQGPEGEKEVGFIREVFSWLIGEDWTDYTDVAWERNYPDDVKIVLKQPARNAWLLWREAYSPNWQARLAKSNEKIKVYRAGPGFILVNLKDIEKGEVLNLSYRLGWFEGWAAKAISMTALVTALVYVVAGGKLKFAKIIGFTKMSGILKDRMKEISREEDEDY